MLFAFISIIACGIIAAAIKLIELHDGGIGDLSEWGFPQEDEADDWA